jgi:DNA-binding PadR family transcriptional regulator
MVLGEPTATEVSRHIADVSGEQVLDGKIYRGLQRLVAMGAISSRVVGAGRRARTVYRYVGQSSPDLSAFGDVASAKA